ncbi:MAG: hypothetical protein HC945_02180 [Nitrosarchaeum sp.]|nr:hypothetical protein [Nitrosarchaeum sp.]
MIGGKILLVSVPSINVPVRVFAPGGTEPELSNFTLEFTLDPDAASVRSMRSAYCAEERCFLPSGRPAELVFEFDNPTGSFDQGLVFYRLGSQSFGMTNCSGNACMSSALVACTEGSEVQLAITGRGGIPSQEDSGYPMIGASETLMCDAQAPRITSVSVLDDLESLNVVRENAPAQVRVVVQERNPGATVEVVLEESEEVFIGACAPEGDGQVCVAEVSFGEGPKTEKLTVRVKDVVGHAVEREVSVLVLEYRETDVAPEFFRVDVHADRMKPQSISRPMLAFTNEAGLAYPVYIPFELVALRSGAFPLRVQMRSCTYERDGERVGGGFFSDVRVADPTPRPGEENRIDLAVKGMSGFLL